MHPASQAGARSIAVMSPKQRTRWLALALALLTLAPLTADAQGSAVARADALRRRAEQAYFRMRMEDAQRYIIEAVSICERERCPAAKRAALYIALGSIAHTASGDGLRARMAIDRALSLDPDVALDRNLATPDVRALYDESRAAHRGGSPPASATPPATSTPPRRSGTAPTAETEPGETGARCSEDADCATGLVCEDAVCSEVSFTGSAPAENRERSRADGPAEPLPPVARVEFARVFIELGYASTAAYAHPNMQVATRPDVGFPGQDFQLDARRDNDAYVLAGTHGCRAPYQEYCVRVTDGLFAYAHGIHAAIGVYPTPRFGLAARVRYAPVAGGGKWDQLVLGLRLYYRPVVPAPEGFHFGIFLGGSYGQIQVHPRQEPSVPGASIPRPWGQTGRYGAEMGFPLGYRITPGFGLFVSPEAYVLAPPFSFGLQVTAGLDVAFGMAH